ncbi:MAG: TIGR02611 family protein [Micromonosporaceae bacterium]
MAEGPSRPGTVVMDAARPSDPDHATPGSGAVPDVKDAPEVKPAGLLDRIRATTAGRMTLKVVVAILGVATIVLGIVMIPLPGPGWLVVFAGLAILSVEYVWAKHLLRYGREKIKGWTHWVGRQSWLARITIGAVGLVFVAGALWFAVRNGFGTDLVQSAWRFLTSN